MKLLIGSTFPLSLIRPPVRIDPSSLGTLRARLPGAEIHSFWGHANTAAMAEAILGVSLFRVSERPPLTLSEARKPFLDGIEFSECWVLSPDYVPGFRPAIGVEVTPEQITGWQVLRVHWL